MMDAIKRHPVLSYIVLTLTWSFGWWSLILTQVAPGALFKLPPNPKAMVFMVLGAAGPIVASLVLTAIGEGRTGLRALWGRFTHWRVGRWWLVALAPWAMNVVLAVAYILTGGHISGADLVAKIGPAIGMGVMASLFEEPGWRGFLLPKLQARYRPFASAVIVGLVWGGIWHGYADYIGLGDLGWRCVPLIVLLGPVLLTAHSVLLTRIYNGTQGSLLLCVAYHFSISSSGFIFSLEYPSYGQNLLWTSIAILIAWAVVGVVLIGTARWPSPSLDPHRTPHDVGLQ